MTENFQDWQTSHEEFQNMGFNLDFRLKLSSLGSKLVANETVKVGPLVVLKIVRNFQNFDSWTEQHAKEGSSEKN